MQYVEKGCLAQLEERRPYKAKVGGSSPSAPTSPDDGLAEFLPDSNKSGVVVQLVRIPACHAGGRGFESRPLRHLFQSHRQRWLFLCKAPRGAAYSRAVHSLFAQSRGRFARKARPFSHSKIVTPTSALVGFGDRHVDYALCSFLCVNSTADGAKVRRGLRTLHAKALARRAPGAQADDGARTNALIGRAV